MDYEPWMERGACRDWHPGQSVRPDPDPHRDPWFPTTTNIDEAQKICATCPVKAACDDFAERNGITAGIWAGVSQRERLRRNRAVRVGPED